jgi:hypothetical protein
MKNLLEMIGAFFGCVLFMGVLSLVVYSCSGGSF